MEPVFVHVSVQLHAAYLIENQVNKQTEDQQGNTLSDTCIIDAWSTQ
jgi:hypothetical protein